MLEAAPLTRPMTNGTTIRGGDRASCGFKSCPALLVLARYWGRVGQPSSVSCRGGLRRFRAVDRVGVPYNGCDLNRVPSRLSPLLHHRQPHFYKEISTLSRSFGIYATYPESTEIFNHINQENTVFFQFKIIRYILVCSLRSI